MKKYFCNIIGLILAAIIIGIGFTSCEDMIKEDKYDFNKPEDIPDSDDGATQWVVGTYSKLSNDMFRWNEFPTVLDFDCDYISGPDWAFKQFGAGNFQQVGEVVSMWEKPYNLIHRANYALENIEKMNNLTPRHKENLQGELYFLKAYGYFLLVRAFGDIPVREKSINETQERNVPRSPVKDVYAHIIDLLTQAQDLMYKNTDSEFTEGRASAGAAAGMLAKVYATIASGAMPAGNEIKVKGGIPYQMMDGEKVYTNPQVISYQKTQVKGYESFDYREYYKLARDKAKEVIIGVYGDYDLLAWDDLWDKKSKNKVEHMFSLQSLSGDPTYGAAFATGYAGIYEGTNIYNGLWYGMRDHWYKLFESKDYRVEKGVLHRWARIFDANNEAKLGSYYPDTDEYRQKATVDKVYPYNDGLNYRCNKDAAFLAFLTKYDDRTNKTIERSDATWPFLRFADVLLIYAEAEAEYNNAPNGDALEALNKIRRRSNATEKSLSGSGNIGSLVDFRSAVLEERAMEFALEGDRRWDLIRWGIYVDVMNSVGGTDESGIYKNRLSRHTLFPIPNSEMDSNESITENNPGWS